MSLCTYGSEPNPGSPPYVWVTWLDAQSWLGVLWGVFAWIGVAAHSALHEVSVFCATEPPQPVYPGDARVLEAAYDPVAFEECLAYIEQSAAWYVWAQVCRCKSSSSGTCTYRGVTWSSLTDYGALTRQMGLIVQPQISGMSIYGARFQVQSSGTPSPTHLVVWDPAGTTIIKDSGAFTPTVGENTYLFSTPLAVTSGQNYTVALYGAGAEHYFGWGTNGTDTTHGDVHYGNYVERDDNSFCPTDVASYKRAIDPIICVGGGPGTDPYAPAAPDVPGDTSLPVLPSSDCTTTADLCALVNSLMVSVASMRNQIDLIQRQHVPFGYIVGTVHSGLTGSGSFSVAGLIGLLVQTSTAPAGWGTSTDEPARFIPSPVSVAVGDSAGDQDHHYCHSAEELWFPDAMGAMTTVSYAFRPGCGGSITELLREP